MKLYNGKERFVVDTTSPLSEWILEESEKAGITAAGFIRMKLNEIRQKESKNENN